MLVDETSRCSLKEELTQDRIEFLKADYARGFIAYCGLEAIRFGKGFLESRLKVLTHHRQQDNYIHAGVIATMADHTAGYAAFGLVPKSIAFSPSSSKSIFSILPGATR